MSRLLLAVTALFGALAAFAPASARAQSGCAANPSLCNLTVHSTIEQADLDVAIDIVLVGDGYTSADAAKWASDAASAVNSFKTASTGLYARAPKLFNFHVVDVVSASNAVSNTDLTDTALGMNVSGAYITANAAKVNLAALNAPDVDQVVAIANAGSGRANADYPSQLASGSIARLQAGGLAVITHELGHGIFHLADEYEEAAICSSWPAPSEPSMLSEPNVTAEPTCYKFQGIAGAGCIQGARYCSTGAWRSASTCFMRTNYGAACPACQAHIDRVLLERRVQADRGAPWVVAAVPGAGSPVAGTVQLSALVFDDWFVPFTLVFEIDGAAVGSVSTASGSSQLAFDTTRLPDGAHSLVVQASDAAGYAAASKAVSFTTLNFTDTTAPSVSITSPANGASLSGMAYVSVAVSGSAADVQQIVLSIDGKPAAISLGSAWLSYPWDLSAVPAGTHTLDAQAIDSSQNVGNAATVTVTTSPGTTPGRGPSILKPVDGAAIGPFFTLEWSAGESGMQGGGGASVELLLDAVEVSPNPLAGKTNSALIDARLWALGPHQLRLRSEGVLGDPVFVVRVAPTTPAAFIASPRPYEVVRGTVSVSLVGADDAAITSLELFADGAPAGSVSGGSGTVAWNTLGKPKQVVLEAVAHSADGGQARSAKTQVRVDNSAPVVAVTRPAQGATVPPGLLGMRVDASDPDTVIAEIALYLDGALVGTSGMGTGAFAFLATVTAGSHTAYAVAKDQAGNQATSASVGFTAASCATTGCDDSDPCTADRCASTGACVHAPAPGCCTGNPDCDDGDACTSDTCAGGTCAHAALAGCCNSGFDCQDADACTKDLCSGLGGVCSHAPAGCCAGAGDCDDGNACTADSCVRVPSTAPNGWCAHDWSPGCCGVDADCDDADACTTDTCSGGSCSHAAIAGCCRDSTACQDGDACTSDQCADHVCTYTPITGCCATNADCTTLNPCSTGTCNKGGYCSFMLTAGCCNFDFECQDADPCTVHACQAHACALVSATAGCADAGVGPPDAAAPGPDAAAAGLDAAAPGLDAASPGPDAAAPGLDASTAGLDASTPGLDASQPADGAVPGTDAAPIAPDAAQPTADAATPAEDGGPMPVDASIGEPDAEIAADAQAVVQEDAGAVIASDAASPSGDGGAVIADAAAVQQADVGMGEVVTSGCGCGTGAGPPPALALAIAVLGAVRRRRIRHP